MGYPKPLCILISDTKGIQWVFSYTSDENDPLKAHPNNNPIRMGIQIDPCDESYSIISLNHQEHIGTDGNSFHS